MSEEVYSEEAMIPVYEDLLPGTAIRIGEEWCQMRTARRGRTQVEVQAVAWRDGEQVVVKTAVAESKGHAILALVGVEEILT